MTNDVVRAYHRAWTSGDVDTALAHVADDIACSVPGATLGKGDLRGYLAGFAPMLTGIGDIAEVASGDQVALFYYPQTPVTSTAPAGELFTVRDGQIVELVTIFDRLSFGPPQ